MKAKMKKPATIHFLPQIAFIVDFWLEFFYRLPFLGFSRQKMAALCQHTPAGFHSNTPFGSCTRHFHSNPALHFRCTSFNRIQYLRGKNLQIKHKPTFRLDYTVRFWNINLKIMCKTKRCYFIQGIETLFVNNLPKQNKEA